MKNPMSPLPRPAAVVAPFALLLGGALNGQVPPNHLLVGTTPDTVSRKNATRSPGTPGLFYVSLQTGKTTRVAGLPKQFTTGGVWGVLRRPSDERIFLGNFSAASGTLNLTKLTMKGSAVSDQKGVSLGTVPSGWTMYLGALCLMPDGRRVLVGTANSLLNGPMTVARLGIVDLDANPPTVTPIKTSLSGIFVFKVVMSRDGKTAFVVTAGPTNNPLPFRLYMVDIRTGASAILHTESSRALSSPRLDRSGGLYLSSTDLYGTNPTPSMVLEFRVTSWGKATVKSHPKFNQRECAGFGALNLATGKTAMLSNEFPNTSIKSPNPFSVFTVDHRTGAIKLLTKPPASGWGAPWALDIHGAMEHYGQTPQENAVGFKSFPNPGGSPTAGNAKFSLTLETTVTAKNPASLLLLGVRKLGVPLLGTRLLVDPVAVFSVVSPTPTKPVTLTFPTPKNMLPGITVFAQWALCAAGTCNGSRGLKIVTQ